MSWQLLLGINLAAATIREFLNKKIANKMSPYVALFYIVLFAQVWLYSIWLITQNQLPRYDLGVSLIGIILVFAFIAYFSAIKISLSQSILFQSYSILITIILTALYLGEAKYFDITTSSGLKLFTGTILAFVSLWYLLHVGNKSQEKLEKKWFVYIAITIIFLGTGSFFSISNLSKYNPMEILISQGNAMVPFFLLLSIFRKEKILVGKRKVLLTFINSIFSTIAVIAFYNALRIVPVSKFFPIQQVSLVIATIATGYIFYNERKILTGRRFIGMSLGLLGIVLLVSS